MQRRITIDVDNVFLCGLLSRFHKIFCKLPRKFKVCIEGLVFKSTNKGYHIIIWLCRPISNNLHFQIREYLGDDKNRIRLDKIRIKKGEPIQILFHKKYVKFYKKVLKNRKVYKESVLTKIMRWYKCQQKERK